MSSSLIVEVCEISEFIKHPNADKLQIAKMKGKGWQIIVGINEYSIGDKIVFIPVDTLIPRHLAQRINDKIENYLSWNERYKVYPQKDDPNDMGRVKAVRLRGEMSYGLIMPNFDNHPLGTNVAEYYGMDKYTAPLKCTEGDALPPCHYFPEYTGIERWENFAGVIEDGTEVVMTEKIHGSNIRLGYCLGDRTETNPDGEMTMMLGSHSVRRRFSGPSEFSKKFDKFPLLAKILKPIYQYLAKNNKKIKSFLRDYPMSHFEKPYHDYPQIKQMLKNVAQERNAKSVVIYGEFFGEGVQKGFHYGKTQADFRAFDISIDMNYIDYDDFSEICQNYNIPTVPLLYRGPFSIEKAREISAGNTTLNAEHIREGCVVKPTTEMKNNWIGRVIVKFISPEYDVKKTEKGGTEDA